MSREFCRDVPHPSGGSSKSLRKKKFVRIFRSLIWGRDSEFEPFDTFLGRSRSPALKTFIAATEPPNPRRVSEGFLKGSLKVFGRGQPRTLQNPCKTASRTPRKPFKKVSKSMMRSASRGLKISSRVRGGPKAGNESGRSPVPKRQRRLGDERDLRKSLMHAQDDLQIVVRHYWPSTGGPSGPSPRKSARKSLKRVRDCKRGQRKGATSKTVQKHQKYFSTLFDIFP